MLTDSSSCIDLLFTSQPNLEMESGVHSSLHQSFHYKIIYGREIWHYQRANVDQIQRVTEQFS